MAIDWAVDSHRKELSKASAQCNLKVFLMLKVTEITCVGFRPISNMSDISYAMGTFSYLDWSH